MIFYYNPNAFPPEVSGVFPLVFRAGRLARAPVGQRDRDMFSAAILPGCENMSQPVRQTGLPEAVKKIARFSAAPLICWYPCSRDRAGAGMRSWRRPGIRLRRARNVFSS